MGREKKLKARPRESIHEIRAAGRESEGTRNRREPAKSNRPFFFPINVFFLWSVKIAGAPMEDRGPRGGFKGRRDKYIRILYGKEQKHK